jgi:hypothetical protein
MRIATLILLLLICQSIFAQDSVVTVDKKKFTLTEVIVRNNFDYKRLLQQIITILR